MGRSEKPEAAVIAAEDLRRYVETQDDFAFEREVYHKAQGLGLAAEHAGLYEDPVTGKPRQFDIRATKLFRENSISLSIECKSLATTYPLLVSCVPRSRTESFHEVLYDVSAKGNSQLQVTRSEGALYREGEPVGKSMRQIKHDSRGDLTSGDEVFDKWMQALASAAELVTHAAHRLSEPGGQRAPRGAAIIPVLVVSDDALWVADYSSNGRLKQDPFRVDDVTFYLGRSYEVAGAHLTFTVSHLHIFTRSRVHTLLQEIAQGGETWHRVFG